MDFNEKFIVSNVNLHKFFPIFLNWCKAQCFPSLHIENVEEVFVCYRENKAVYCCFVWNTNSKMCLIGFPVKNPFVDYEFRKGGLPYLLSEMAKELKKRGYTKIWTTSGTPSVEKSLRHNDFVKAEEKVNVYIKIM